MAASRSCRLRPYESATRIIEIIVEKAVDRSLHLAVLGGIVVLACVGSIVPCCSYILRILLEVKHRKRANITQAVDMNRKFAEEIDDLVTAPRKAEVEDKWGDENSQELLQKYYDSNFVEKAELSFDVVAVKSALPLVWLVMSILYNTLHCKFRVEDVVFFRYL